MRAREIMQALFALSEEADFSNTCDTLKAGDAEKEVQRVAVAMLPTIEVLKAAHQWGADLLIVHEPMYFNHRDAHSDDPIEVQKRALVSRTGMTIWRYHDHPHATRPDIIDAGVVRSLALDAEVEIAPDNTTRLHLAEPMTPAALQAYIEKNWGLRHIRICGSKDAPCSHITLRVGAGGSNVTLAELQRPECEIILAGELSEWSIGEYARDAAALGHKKAVLILGHEGSEREGMIYTADLLKEMYPTLEIKYFESEETYA